MFISACECDPVGTVTDMVCAPVGGQCPCKPGVYGRQCDRCAPGYYNFTTDGCKGQIFLFTYVFICVLESCCFIKVI